jgi:hypothetical protein
VVSSGVRRAVGLRQNLGRAFDIRELTDPFFLIVNCPTVFRGGRARSSIWKRQADKRPSKLPPTMIPGPEHSTHPIMASCHPALRVPESMNARALQDYLETGTLVCHNENGNLFHFVKGPAMSEDDGEFFMDWFGQHHDRSEEMLWTPRNRDGQPNAVR